MPTIPLAILQVMPTIPPPYFKLVCYRVVLDEFGLVAFNGQDLLASTFFIVVQHSCSLNMNLLKLHRCKTDPFLSTETNMRSLI